MRTMNTKMVRKTSIAIFSVSLMSVCAITFSSCSIFTSNNGPSYNNNAAKIVNFVPRGTPYENIFNSEFSFMFQNSGGYNVNGTYKKDKYVVFGTGWLFDYSLNPAQDTWTGYFGTNLHVADSLLNLQDNPEYAPYNLRNITNPSKINALDYTEAFWFGKYDNFSNNPLLSSQSSSLTYVKLNALPKTQYAAIDFYTTPQLDNHNNVSKYIDFAVLQITLDWSNNNQNAKYEKAIYDSWITPAINNLAAMTSGPLVSKTETLFWREEWISNKKNMLGDYSAYIAGYPFYEIGKPPYAPQTQTGNPGIPGSPAWTINIDKGTQENYKLGQDFDTKGLSRSSGFPTNFPTFGEFHGEDWYGNGIYLADDHSRYPSFAYTYHGVRYNQSGMGFIINNSNLAGGSSGSMLLGRDKVTQQKQIMGIYFGTFLHNEREVSFGLAQALVMTKSIADMVNSHPSNNFKVRPYDLIAGDIKQNKSFKTSLGSEATYLFPQGSATSNEPSTIA